MNAILIAYATTEGQTRKIAEHIAKIAGQKGLRAELLDVAEAGARDGLPEHDAVILGASVHGGRHQRAMARFVKKHAHRFERVPTAFYSVSLTAAKEDPEHLKVADDMVRRFLTEVGWEPDRVWLVAGALAYRRYSPLKRFLLRQIARREGGDVDTSRDHEYTDWQQLDEQVGSFLHGVFAVESGI